MITRRAINALLFAMALQLPAGYAAAEPVKIRLGYGYAAEEQLWLLIAKPDIGKGFGKAYVLEPTRFTGSDKRTQAFEAGAIDIASSSANGVIFGAAEGVQAKIIASLTRESKKGFSTTYYASASSSINSVADLKGKTIGVNGFATSGHLWLRTALEKAGLQESDVVIVPTSFPSMVQSLISGRLDVGQFPQPFAAMLTKEASVKKIFTAKDAIPTDEELLVLIGKDEYLKANAEAVRAFLADLKTATQFYLNNTQQARQILIDRKLVRLPPDVFLGMDDYYRDPDLKVDVKSLETMQDNQVRAGFQKKTADISKIVDQSYLPK